MKKYLLLGDTIPSKYDNDEHFISAQQLKEAYRLDPRECIFSIAGKDGELSRRGINLDADLIILRPRFDGDYLEHLAQLLSRKPNASA